MELIVLAWRSIWRNRRRTLITLSSIGFGLGLAIFFISFADGVYSQMVEDAVRTQAGHITLEHPEYRDAPAVDLAIDGVDALRAKIDAMPTVDHSKAMVLGQGVARSGSGAVGVAVLGVEPAVEVETSPLARNIKEGDYLTESDGAKVVVGKLLAERLKLSVGKKLVITSNDVNGDLVEELLRVKGIFEMGVEEVDGYVVQIPLAFARKLYSMEPQQATQLGVVLRDAETRDEVLVRVQHLVEGRTTAVLPWEDVLPDLATYIRFDRSSNLIFQGIILFLIGFTIFNTLLMSVLERGREFAVLLALGTPAWKVKIQVVYEAVFIGLVGSVVGLVIGCGSAYAMQVYGLDLRLFVEEGVSVSGFAIDPIMRAELRLPVVATLTGLVLVSTLVMSLFTMRKSTDVNLADVLRG